ncbi:MAG: adenylyltransferase/cytidyltransferase family protein [Patescibacteria group bacterium]
MCAFGTFDVIHPGHIAYLMSAKRLGDELVVVVTRDEVVKRRKGRVAVCTEKDRRAMVSSLRMVDKVILGDRDDSWRVLTKVKPSIIFLGYDQKKTLESLVQSPPYRSLSSPLIRLAKSYKPMALHSSLLNR